MTAAQLDLFSSLASGLCRYGTPAPGAPRPCSAPASHAVVGTTDSGPHAGHVARLECCLVHANYYARGWLSPSLLYPGYLGAVWMEALS